MPEFVLNEPSRLYWTDFERGACREFGECYLETSRGWIYVQ